MCLPYGAFDNTILPFCDDLMTIAPGGIYTTISGIAPNRIFNIEWRACLYTSTGCGANVNFEARLYEGQNRFDVIYGAMGDTGGSATVGVQKDTGSMFTQFECNTGGMTQGLM